MSHNVIIPHHAITSDGGAASQWPPTHASYLSLCWLAFLIQTTDGIIIIRIWPTDNVGVRVTSAWPWRAAAHTCVASAGLENHRCRPRHWIIIRPAAGVKPRVNHLSQDKINAYREWSVASLLSALVTASTQCSICLFICNNIIVIRIFHFPNTAPPSFLLTAWQQWTLTVEAAAGGHNTNITVNTQLQDTLLPSVNMNMVMRMVHGPQTPSSSSSSAPVYTLRMLLFLQELSYFHVLSKKYSFNPHLSSVRVMNVS